jgi:hypothetical protein
MSSLIDGEDNKNVVEELSEVMYILTTSSADVLKSHSEWATVVKEVKNISKMKVKSKPSISNKTIFRHMDILDKLN